MKVNRLLVLVILIAILFIGYAICSRGKSGVSTDSGDQGGGVGFIGKVSEIKGEMVKIRMEIQELETKRRDLANEKSERLRNNESSKDLDQEMKEIQVKINNLEAREQELMDQLSRMRK
jgi:seryl-tRNA synthetase